MTGSHLEKMKGSERFVDEQTTVIAGVLARWQSNGHLFPLRGHIREGNVRDNSLSALYCYLAKLNHSCEPNTRFDVDAGTGRMVVYALRAIKAGEELTSDYIGHGPTFRTMSVEGRRALIRPRGFVCLCTKCLRESGEQMPQMPPSVKTNEGEAQHKNNGKGFKIKECDRKSGEQANTKCEKKRESHEGESSAGETESTNIYDEEDAFEIPEVVVGS